MDGTRVSTPARSRTEASTASSAIEHPSVGSQVWHFARHYLEMCAAMCIGGVILNTLVFAVGPTLVGYPDLRQRYVGPALVVDAVMFTAPRATWMRIRGMAWYPTVEMSGATVGLAIVVVALSGIGVVSQRPTRVGECLLRALVCGHARDHAVPASPVHRTNRSPDGTPDARAPGVTPSASPAGRGCRSLRPSRPAARWSAANRPVANSPTDRRPSAAMRLRCRDRHHMRLPAVGRRRHRVGPARTTTADLRRIFVVSQPDPRVRPRRWRCQIGSAMRWSR
jgi:hypothetical protein